MGQMMGRRDFGKSLVGSAAVGSVAAQGRAQAPDNLPVKTIAIQVGAVSFVDEGIEKVLDIFQQRAHINCLSLSAFTYTRGTGGRQVPGHPLPDHGKLQYDEDFRGGNFATVHPRYYKDAGIDPMVTRAPDHGSWDFLATVVPAARKRGMKTLAWITDKWRVDIPGIEKLAEVDLGGRTAAGASLTCHNNPYYRNLMLGIVEDYIRSYDVDGIHSCQERSGPLEAALAGYGLGRVTCFCDYCQARAKTLGIDTKRVKTGYEELEKFVRACKASERPVDGYYVAFWRLLLKHPEILIWANFYEDSIKNTYEALYHQVKSLNPKLWFGLHIAHDATLSPIRRAVQDTSELTRYADFLKMVMYHNCAGPRFARFIDRRCETIYGDVPPEQLVQLYYRILNYREVPYGKLRQAGFKNDYVYRESKRNMDAARGSKTLIFSGLDIDIPTGLDESRSTPEDVKAAVLQAFRAGVDGIILSRKYSEMRLENLSGAGSAIEELGLG